MKRLYQRFKEVNKEVLILCKVMKGFTEIIGSGYLNAHR